MKARFQVDRDALEHARHELGVTKRVDVVVRSFGWRSGRYVGIRGGRHRISIASYLSPRSASRALWHELTHALQVERLGGHEAFESQWWTEMRALGLSRQQALHATGRRYRRAPLEAEATANERRHRDLPLAYPRRRPSRLIAAVRRALGP